MNKAVFLDRDGVINRERGYTFRLEDFEILPDVMDVLKIWQDKGYLLIIVSNQSGISKKLYTQNDVEMLHEYLLQQFSENNISISEIYYCMHHPDETKCICRKPDSLFIEKSLARFNIDPKVSYFIGDKERDIEASEKANVKGFLINANDSLQTLIDEIS